MGVTLQRFFARLGGVFARIHFHPRQSFADPASSRFPKEKPILFLLPYREKNDFSFVLSFFGFRSFRLLPSSVDFSKKERLFAGINSDEDLALFFSKKKRGLLLCQNEKDYETALLVCGRYGVPLCLLAPEKRQGFFKRRYLNISPVSLPEENRDGVALQKKMNELLEQGRIYRKYHLYGLCHISDFIMDLARLLVLPKMALLYPTHYLYTSEAARKNRHHKGKGIAISNHVAFLDAQMMPRIYPYRRLRMVVGDIVYRNNGRLMHYWLRQAHVVHVGDKLSDPELSLQGFAEALELLKGNAFLGLFPEGEIHWNGSLGSFHAGVVGLSLLSGAKIYPSYTLKPYRLFHRQIVVVGDAIDFAPSGSFNKETLNTLSHVLEVKMQELKHYGEMVLEQKKRGK